MKPTSTLLAFLTLATIGPAWGASGFVQGELVRADLLTHDPAEAVRFYEEAFGWNVRATDTSGYLRIENDGRPIGHVIAHEPLNPAEPEVQWLVSVAADDVDDLANRAAALGGSVLLAPEDGVTGERQSVIEDPEGAVLVLTESRADRSTVDPPRPGDLLWVELLSDRPDAAATYYQRLLGYERGEQDGYLTLSSGGRIRTGIVKNPWPDVEPNWLVYVLVENVRDTLEAASRAGGLTLLAPSESLDDGRIALLADPTGGVVAIQQRSTP